ncbi:MAG: DUF4040 domain-containing protein [Bacillota bacterium]|nr:DUF4040 domain-containing protein [Bacillota bacterium]
MTPVFSALLALLIACAVVVACLKNIFQAVIVFAAYSLIMAVLWQLLGAPDVAITEAAVGAGVTSLLFFGTIAKTGGRPQ